MLSNIEILTSVLTIIIIAIVVLLMILVLVYFFSKRKKTNKVKKVESTTTDTKGIPKEKTFAVASVMDFMEFDTVEDNMIVQKDGNKYIMVLECQGINYDLMSEVEKNSVEEGFIQLLNTLRFPIQLYIQTRSLNLRDILDEYKNKIKEIQRQIEHLDIKIKEAERRRRNSS